MANTSTILSASLLALVLSALGTPDSRAETVDRVLAVVGTRVITLSDARAAIAFGFVRPSPGSDPIAEGRTYLVNRELILTEVERYAAPPPDPALLTIRLDEVRSRVQGASQLQAALRDTAMTEERLRDIVSDTIRIEDYLDSRFTAQAQPTAEEVQRYYRDHSAEFAREGTVPPFEEARPAVHARLTLERRAALIAEWLDRLQRRTQVLIRN